MKDKKREHLISIITYFLLTGKSILEYYKSVAETKEEKLKCNKSIRSIDKAIKTLCTIKHIELLEYIYSLLIGNNAIAYSISGQIILSPKMKHYDSEKGFTDFQEMIKEKQQEAEERLKKQRESEEALKKAKALGKKVEMVYDKESKTTKPMIVDDKVVA